MRSKLSTTSLFKKQFSNQEIKKRRVHPGVARVCALALAVSLANGLYAQENIEEIRVTGSRLRQTGMDTPTPVTQVSTSELRDMNPRQMVESLTQLPQFFGNTRPQNTGALTTGGSNLNLRGLGGVRTLVLLNGRRVPSGNRFGTVNISAFPEGAISNVETVTGGASAAYGTDAVAGVVNFIINTEFEGFTGRVQGGMTSRNDGENTGASVTYGTKLGDKGHLLVSADFFNQETIHSLRALQERPWFQQRALVTNPDPNGPTFIARNFVRQTNMSATGIINRPGSALDKLEFVRSGDSIITQPLNFTGVGRLNGGCNCFAENERDRSWGMDAGNAVQAGNGRRSGFVYTDYDLTDSTKIYFQGMYGFTKLSGPWFRNPVLTGPWQATIFRENPFLPQNVRDIMDQENITSFNMGYSGVSRRDEPGPLGFYRADQNDTLTSGTIGLQTTIDSGFFSGWNVDVYGQYGRNSQKQIFRDGIIMGRLPLAMDAVIDPRTGSPACRAALVNPDTFGNCVPVNLFGGVQSVSPQAASYLLDEEAQIRSRSGQIWTEFVMDGEIHQGIGAGPIMMALGGSFRRDTIRQWKADLEDEFVFLNGVNTGFRGLIPENQPNGMLGVRPGSVPPGFTGNASLSNVLFTGSYQTEDTVLEGAFNVGEVFTEVNIPLISDTWFANQIDTSLAFRYADYTGSGGINSWKIGLSWQINDDLRFRTTRSRDVRAASLRERFDATAGGANVLDPLFNNAVIGTASRSGGNPNVNPEEADTWTVGFVWQPSFLEGFSTSVDWYSVDLNNAISQLGFQNIIDLCFRGATDLCQYIIRDPSTNQITRIDNLFLNIANSRLRGVDLEFRYTRDVNIFGGDETLTWRNFGNRVIELSNQLPGVNRDFVGLEQPEWRLVSQLAYSNGGYRAFVQGRWMDNRTLNRLWTEGVQIDNNTVASVLYVDLNLSYDFEMSGQSWRVFANVTNLLDRAPPQTPGAPGFVGGTAGPSTVLYDTIGRTYMFGMNMSF